MKHQDLIQKSRETYNITGWSDGYFDINNAGELCIKNHQNNSLIPFNQVVESCKEQGLSFPLLLRFSDILEHKVDEFFGAFKSAFEKHDYNGSYCAAYPIKVNQERKVVEYLLENPNNIGLEAGSKPELLAVLAAGDPDKNLIICNGFKDRDYIRLALIGQQMGFEVNIIVEKLSELDLVISEAKKININPRIGIRLRLSSIGRGLWQNTGGFKGKFGLSASQILEAINTLKEHNFLNNLKLLHFHIGSQIADLDDLEQGILESIQYFNEISKLGAHLDTIDMGGGVGIDYTGTHSEHYFSRNYSIAEYAELITKLLKNNIDKNYPRIITECGRAMVSHHAVLVTDILNVESIGVDEQEIEINSKNALKIWDELNKNYKQAQQDFNKNKIDLIKRSEVDNYYYAMCKKIHGALDINNRNHRDLIDDLNEKLAHKFICNFSIFQSLPDVWGLDQVFPIMPLSSLDQNLSMRAIVHDLTCDSDGAIDNYVDIHGVEKTLPLPDFKKHNYLLGFFLIGAYQEILGDLHNLFGDPNSANIVFDENSYTIEHLEKAEKICDVLRHVDFSKEYLLEKFNSKDNKFIEEIRKEIKK